jgi:hypothetical protein
MFARESVPGQIGVGVAGKVLPAGVAEREPGQKARSRYGEGETPGRRRLGGVVAQGAGGQAVVGHGGASFVVTRKLKAESSPKAESGRNGGH